MNPKDVSNIKNMTNVLGLKTNISDKEARILNNQNRILFSCDSSEDCETKLKKYQYTRNTIRNNKTNLRRLLIISLAGLLLFSAFAVGFNTYKEIQAEKSRFTSISLIIPNDFYINFYESDNQTLAFHNNYTIYLIMMSGIEYENDIDTQVGHTQNFIDQRLLSYFLDIDPYNLSWFQDDFILNGKNLTLNFTASENSTNFGVGACDFSMFNETINYRSLDFGNTPFMNFTIGQHHNVYINGIDCYLAYENHYRPFLSYTIDNQVYHERMAWNNTLYIA